MEELCCMKKTKYRSAGRITGSSAEEPKSALEKVQKGQMALFPSWQKVLDGSVCSNTETWFFMF